MQNKNSKKSLFNTVVFFLFLAFLILPTLLWFGGCRKIKTDSSMQEKRELTPFPTKGSNDWLSDFEQYYNDHAPFRTPMIEAQSSIAQEYETFYRQTIAPELTSVIMRSPSGKATPTPLPPTFDPNAFRNETPIPSAPTWQPEPTGDPDCDHVFGAEQLVRKASCAQEGITQRVCSKCGYVKATYTPQLEHTYELIREQTATSEQYGFKLYRCTGCGGYQTQNITDKKTDTSYLAPQTKGKALYGRNDWLFYTEDNSIGCYQGTNIMSQSEMQSRKKTFEELKAICDKKGIKLAVIIGPNKEQVYPEYMPTYQIVNAKKREDVFLEYMQQNSAVPFLYPLNDLRNAKLFYDVYYKQDTHWNEVGGFMGVMAVYRALGLPVTNLLDVSVRETTKKGGDLAYQSGFSTRYTDYVVNYRPEIQSKRKDLDDVSSMGPGELQHWTSNAATDAKLVVIGDSFRLNMAKFFSKDFSDVMIIHRGDAQLSIAKNALKNLKSGDCLVIVAVERYDIGSIQCAQSAIKALK